jgi:hypothetical protein
MSSLQAAGDPLGEDRGGGSASVNTADRRNRRRYAPYDSVLVLPALGVNKTIASAIFAAAVEGTKEHPPNEGSRDTGADDPKKNECQQAIVLPALRERVMDQCPGSILMQR